MRLTARRTFLTVALLSTLPACDDVATDPPAVDRRVLGALQLERPEGQASEAAGPDTPVQWSVPPGERGTVVPPNVLVAPDTVRAGVPFTVTVHTIGVSGCWRADGQDVSVADGVATITPWDAHSGAEVCTEVLGYLPHQAQVTFATPGVAVVRVAGRRLRLGDRTWEQPVSAQRTLVVR